MSSLRTAAASIAMLLLGSSDALTPSEKPEVHPQVTTYRCTLADGCSERTNFLVADSLAHPVYQRDNPEENCGNWGNAPPSDVCPDEETCHENCIIDGMSLEDYARRGVITYGTNIYLTMINHLGQQVSPRVYLLDETENEYDMLYLVGQEFAFEVDMEALPCGMNSALYTDEMYADGNRGALNPTGATYGQGYCDAQCYTTPFINGIGNIEGKGACCAEMDIWEANSRATHFAPHTCSIEGVYLCEGEECGRSTEGVCDKSACAQNPYRYGEKDYYGRGPNFAVDTKRRFTVVTRFHSDPNTGVMTSMERLYIQDGNVIEMPIADTCPFPPQNQVDDVWCEGVKYQAFTRNNDNVEGYLRLGGTESMSASLDRGHVLAMSLWWDQGGNMTWLDGFDTAGPCMHGEGNPSNIIQVEPKPEVTFSNLRWGEIGSTTLLEVNDNDIQGGDQLIGDGCSSE